MGSEIKPNGSLLAWCFHPDEDLRLREGWQQTKVTAYSAPSIPVNPGGLVDKCWEFQWTKKKATMTDAVVTKV